MFVGLSNWFSALQYYYIIYSCIIIGNNLKDVSLMKVDHKQKQQIITFKKQGKRIFDIFPFIIELNY